MSFTTHSECGQDLFPYKILQEGCELYEGTFIDIGCADPIYRNNSYGLEKYCGWKGVLVDYRSDLRTEIEANRTSPFVCADIRDPSWINKVKEVGLDSSKPIDYL